MLLVALLSGAGKLKTSTLTSLSEVLALPPYRSMKVSANAGVLIIITKKTEKIIAVIVLRVPMAVLLK
jgi:hypothetical protein